MDGPLLPDDFSAFLRLLNAYRVDYLVVGGYAVGFHGYPRATADLDVWVDMSPDNAVRVVDAVRAFGFDLPSLTPELFTRPTTIVRFGLPPFRIEIMTTIDGVDFETCRTNAVTIDAGTPLPVISLDDLKRNKRAAGRHKDLADLDALP